jgi:hypothetical protein
MTPRIRWRAAWDRMNTPSAAIKLLGLALTTVTAAIVLGPVTSGVAHPPRAIDAGQRGMAASAAGHVFDDENACSRRYMRADGMTDRQIDAARRGIDQYLHDSRPNLTTNDTFFEQAFALCLRHG